MTNQTLSKFGIKKAITKHAIKDTEARKQIWADLRAVEARMRADGLI